MTDKELFATIRALGLTARKVDSEYRVAFPGNEDSAYYTDCKEDALGTAKAMMELSAAAMGVATYGAGCAEVYDFSAIGQG